MVAGGTREVRWNGMVVDWEGVGPERRFEVRVPNVLQAGKFYRDVFGAEETFRQQTHNGKVFRLGFVIGRIGFAISSEGDIEQERPLLSSIAEELGSALVAVLLPVEDPGRISSAAPAGRGGPAREQGLDLITV